MTDKGNKLPEIKKCDHIKFHIDDHLIPAAKNKLGLNFTKQKADSSIVKSNNFLVKVGITIIYYYQQKISPMFGSRCVYEPTCSEYARIALIQKGFFKGSLMSIKRLLRCKPGTGGVDYP